MTRKEYEALIRELNDIKIPRWWNFPAKLIVCWKLVRFGRKIGYFQ